MTPNEMVAQIGKSKAPDLSAVDYELSGGLIQLIANLPQPHDACEPSVIIPGELIAGLQRIAWSALEISAYERQRTTEIREVSA